MQAFIRVGDTVQISFRIREPEVYPVDFYYLMDVSYSMKEDLVAVTNLATTLGEFSPILRWKQIQFQMLKTTALKQF